METARFDALARALGQDTTRRGITRLLGGLALNGLLHPLANAAKKRGNDKKRGKGNGKQGNDGTVRASATKPPKFNPPKKSYLALGDSLAFGFQFDIFNQHFPSVPPELFVHGYVDEFGHMLQPIRPDSQTINYGCPGETTDSFIRGGCFYTARGFELHDRYSGSQLDAAIAFLRSHRGQVSPITFNLGINDLNALSDLCGDDVSCYEREGPLVLDQIAGNLDEILGAVRAAAPNSEIMTFTNYNVDPRFLELIDAFNAVVKTTAAAHGVRVADVFAAFNGPPQPETICRLTFVCTSGDVHPSDAGYQVIADQLWQVSAYEKLEH
jgi:lysophospholipase L1-like esterase